MVIINFTFNRYNYKSILIIFTKKYKSSKEMGLNELSQFL